MPARKFQSPNGRFVIEVQQDPTTHRTQLYVYDCAEEILQIPCVHVVIATSIEQLETTESMDDLVNLSRENRVGTEMAQKVGISDEDLFWAHCSNIEYWIESGMPPEGLASNLSVPILRAMAGRDPRLASDLAFLVEDLVNRSPADRQPVIVERYGALLPGLWWLDHTQFIPTVSAEVLLPVARDSTSPPALLELFALNVDPRVRNAVASNRSLPEKSAALLSKDPFMDVRYTLARNPMTPPAILLDFSQYRHILMRTCVAQNPATPLVALSALFETSGMQVKQAILENPACTRNFLDSILASDPPDAVRNMVVSQIRKRFPNSRVENP